MILVVDRLALDSKSKSAVRWSHLCTLPKNRILIVDDEPDITLVLKMGLEANGFVVKAYNDPIQVLSNFSAGSYDLLLLDIKMPKMNGFELYKRLQQIDHKVKICFITAFELYFDEFRRIFPKLKVECFVSKPVSIDILSKVIKEELQG
jgi:DNA-binding response OmpR family regulator